MKTLKFKLIFSSFILIFFLFAQSVYSQNINERKLTRTEKKIAKQKNLLKIEMKVLLDEGYSLDKIKNTPTEELKKETGKKVFDIKVAYNKCNQERNLLKQKEKTLRKENEELQNKIKQLKQKNIELELKNKELQEKLKGISN